MKITSLEISNTRSESYLLSTQDREKLNYRMTSIPLTLPSELNTIVTGVTIVSDSILTN